ncbi:MAG TPA: hypothetical protein VIZ65_06525 [Cellvibrionaceae bacterium]
MRTYLKFLLLAVAFLFAGCVAQDKQAQGNETTNPPKISSSSSSSSGATVSSSTSSTSSSGYFDNPSNCNLEKNPTGNSCNARQGNQICGCAVIKGKATCGCATFPVDASGQFTQVCDYNNQCTTPHWTANCSSNVAPCEWKTNQGDWARCDIGGYCVWSGTSASSTSSSTSTSNSSSGTVVFKPGDWNATSCTLDKPENHPCQYSNELSVCGCSAGTCGCAAKNNAVDPNLVWGQTSCSEYSPNRPCRASGKNFWINCDTSTTRCDFERGVYGQPGWINCTGSNCSYYIETGSPSSSSTSSSGSFSTGSSSSSSSSGGAFFYSAMVNTANENNPRGCSESSILECQFRASLTYQNRQFDTLVAAINTGSTETAFYGAAPLNLGDIQAPAPLAFTEDQFFTGGKAVTLTNKELLATTLPTSGTVRTGKFSYKIPATGEVRAEIRLVPTKGSKELRMDYQVNIENQGPRTFTFDSINSGYAEQILVPRYVLVDDGFLEITFDFPSDEIGVGSILVVKNR